MRSSVRTAREHNSTEKAFQSLLNELESRLPEPVDFTHLARRHGFSQSTFRRLWNKQIAVPPARYVMEHRLQHAGRLLTNTDLSVSEIAARIHFEDPLYFSRKFRSFSGLPPTEFRRRYRNPTSAGLPDAQRSVQRHHHSGYKR
ncbi:helix-turn-helix domain-containing protein [Pontiella agarivorans]|uniref:Helix-turn-helix domain-containing protein n=1 Tax=Pontiella agarivorans TaxID=3038953 RepID=A0ABU5MTJ7_9BACT|nr:helix-turn-helix domain-containing protein [Pontiella agarivorans]MDZ8117534.1 helix-turn-helix domain-containing protein [Pontiella agarivorans]